MSFTENNVRSHMNWFILEIRTQSIEGIGYYSRCWGSCCEENGIKDLHYLISLSLSPPLSVITNTHISPLTENTQEACRFCCFVAGALLVCFLPHSGPLCLPAAVLFCLNLQVCTFPGLSFCVLFPERSPCLVILPFEDGYHPLTTWERGRESGKTFLSGVGSIPPSSFVDHFSGRDIWQK